MMFRAPLFLCFFLVFSLQGEDPFTAEVIKKKVRLRASPSLESPVVRELSSGDLLVVDGEQEGFYAVRPPREVKLYLFRTFVLEGVVEGNHVNVRLAPDLEAPVVTRLNMGDSVVGEVSSLHPKWMEIVVPDQVRFYISKDFVKKVGDEHFLTLREERFDEVQRLLADGEKRRQEIDLAYEDIDIVSILKPFKQVIESFKEFAHQVAYAEDTVREIEQAYLLKKVAYLEAKTTTLPLAKSTISERPSQASQFMASTRIDWAEIEKKHFQYWKREKGEEGTPYTFYKTQAENAESLIGVLEPYLRTVKEKPGDFVLLDSKEHLPIAYLYSTRVDLLEQVGKEVEIKGLRRPNNQFNHPAFFVWEIRDVSTPIVGGLSRP